MCNIIKSKSSADEHSEIDMAEYLKQRENDGKPLIIIDPMGDMEMLKKPEKIIAAMEASSMQWTGDNCIEVSEFLGHEDFHHKNGYLLIEGKEGVVAIPKGHFFGKDNEGNPIIYIDPKGDRDAFQEEMLKQFREIKAFTLDGSGYLNANKEEILIASPLSCETNRRHSNE